MVHALLTNVIGTAYHYLKTQFANDGRAHKLVTTIAFTVFQYHAIILSTFPPTYLNHGKLIFDELRKTLFVHLVTIFRSFLKYSRITAYNL